MTKKFLALTMVLVLAAGFAAVAQDSEDRPLTGEWENTLTLDPQLTENYLETYYFDDGVSPNAFYKLDPATSEAVEKSGPTSPFTFASDLSLTYEAGGLTYNLEADLDYDKAGMPTYDYADTGSFSHPPYWQSNGLTDLEVGVDSSIGLLDLSSTANFDVNNTDLDYWKNTAALTLGGVSITDTFVLQPTMEKVEYYAEWSETQTDSYTVWEETDTLGAGMNLKFSGETPGGVSVTVENLFGMEKVTNKGTGRWSPFTKSGDVSGNTFSGGAPYDTGYNILTSHDPASSESAVYGASSMQYVESILTVDNLSMGCCDFSNETMFSEANGFEYTLFEGSMEANNLPLNLDADLKFTTQTKSITLDPSLETDWACVTVYSGLTTDGDSNTLANNSETYDTLQGFEIRGFALTGVELGHVEVSSYTALGDNSLGSMTQSLMFYPYGGNDEVIRISKLEKYPLDFTLDTFFDMSDSDSLFDLSAFWGSMEYKVDDEFTVGTDIAFEPDSGLDELAFNFDYSF